ncbi:MAG: bifunctional glutamate N-acetyltransferase/amino-acid acetyltransferase ArgJ [Planctomycetota bacterium]
MPKVVGHPPSVTWPRGFRAAGVACGIKPSGKPDLALIVADELCTAAGVFTTNRFPGEPVKVTRKHLERTGGRARAIVCNSGISNVATGRAGFENAAAMCRMVAGHVGCLPEEVLVASTGVIGPALPMEKIERGIGEAFAKLDRGEAADEACARAIMTTDTVPKHATAAVGDGGAAVGGIAKGAGMIAPNMATMLGFLTTDAPLSGQALGGALRAAAGATFNRLSIDSDTSTSDAVLVLAGGRGESADRGAVEAALGEVSGALCDQLAWDGEGVTRLIRLEVAGAADEGEAGRVARSVIDSPLVKCAVHGGDPNWGRLVMAIGKSGAAVEPSAVSIAVGRGGAAVGMLERGEPVALGDEQRAALDAAMGGDEVWLTIDLGRGSWSGVWTGVDLSKGYVSINADYTT